MECELAQPRPKTVLIMTVGTSLEPLQKALEQAAKNHQLDKILALYGAAQPSQSGITPMDVAARLRNQAKELGCALVAREISNPHNIDTCLAEMRDIFAEHISADAGHLLVDYTGGSKPLSASLVLATVGANFDASVCFEYMSVEKDKDGKPIGETMASIYSTKTIVREREQDTIEFLKRGDFTQAYLAAERLPDSGKAGFLKGACTALYLWDGFQYQESAPVLTRIKGAASALLDDLEYTPISSLILRLAPISDDLSGLINFIKEMKELEPEEEKQKRRLFTENAKLKEGYLTAIADCVENAWRRSTTSPVEAVMRAYRAVELAVKFELLSEGINPDKPLWSDADTVEYTIRKVGARPFVTLDHGVRMLKALGYELDNAFDEDVRRIRDLRNNCYLEHGFDEVSKAAAEEVLACANRVIARLLDWDQITQLRKKVSLSLAGA